MTVSENAEISPWDKGICKMQGSGEPRGGQDWGESACRLLASAQWSVPSDSNCPSQSASEVWTSARPGRHSSPERPAAAARLRVSSPSNRSRGCRPELVSCYKKEALAAEPRVEEEGCGEGERQGRVLRTAGCVHTRPPVPPVTQATLV